MPYTVGKLAKISSISVRTLHWYDEIGLLKPVHCRENGYRYYEAEQLLQLQQILFFRQLGFKLSDIQKMLTDKDFDRIRALCAHKKILEESITCKIKLIDTIDKTLLHLTGEQNMQDEDFYAGLSLEKKKEYETYLVKYQGTIAEDLILGSIKRTMSLNKSELEEINRVGNEIYKELSECIERELGPRSDEVQSLIHRHYQMVECLYDISKDVYTGLAQLYCEHPDFKKCFEHYHPKIIEFIAEGMRVYAHMQLSNVPQCLEN